MSAADSGARGEAGAYYVFDRGTTSGPFQTATIVDMLRRGSIGPDAQVAAAGTQTWVPLREIAAFAGPFAGAMQRRFAGFWIRFLAYLVDGLVFSVAAAILTAVLAVPFGGLEAASQGSDRGAALGFLPSLVTTLTSAWFLSSAWQATPGKRLCGLAVIRSDGSRLSFLRALGRSFAEILSALFLMLGFLMIGWTREKTGLHDLICDTRVVYRQS